MIKTSRMVKREPGNGTSYWILFVPFVHHDAVASGEIGLAIDEQYWLVVWMNGRHKPTVLVPEDSYTHPLYLIEKMGSSAITEADAKVLSDVINEIIGIR